jgi:hypothetical protein
MLLISKINRCGLICSAGILPAVREGVLALAIGGETPKTAARTAALQRGAALSKSQRRKR